MPKETVVYDDICYEKPFLTQVIVRIDFVAPLEAINAAPPPKIAKIASQRFPISEPAGVREQQVQVGPGGVQHSEHSFKVWNYYGKDREKHLALAASFLFVSFSHYESYEDLKENWSSVVDVAAKELPDARVGRFGLRYINQIRIDGHSATEWGDYIAQDLLGMAMFVNQPDALTRLFHVAELKHDDLDLKFQFGLPNPDYPAVIKQPLFVLDIDGYVQTAHELMESLKFMDDAHERIQNLFEQSITQKLRERMYAVGS
jgi:uncharacterized protein (TIGR04255 family)